MEPKDTPVAILAGGRGTRLAPVADLPKALVPVAGRPFIMYPLAALHFQGFRRIFLLTGYGAAQIESALAKAGTNRCHGFARGASYGVQYQFL